MSTFRWRTMPLAAVVCATAALMPAQQITPHIGYIYPAGGRQGTTFEIVIGGQFLNGANEVYVSGAGVHAKVIEVIRPISQMQFQKLRDDYLALAKKKQQNKSQWTPEDDNAMSGLQQKLASAVRKPANPAIGEIARVQVTVEANAEPGNRDLRLGSPTALTNPLVFSVGQLPEFSKPHAKVIDEIPRFTKFLTPFQAAPKSPAAITLPAIINGQIIPGGVDRYRFQAQKGQHLVIAVAARSLIPYISDAVPGWFQAVLALSNAKGENVAYSGNFRFQQDPVLEYDVAEDEDYTLEIRDSIYRGREDFVYRISAGELPFITDLFPLGAKSGSRTKVEVKGWNLPVSNLTEDTKQKAPGIATVSVRKGEWFSNQAPFAVDTLKESAEKEANDRPEHAQRIKLPLIINGRIDKPGDSDVFRFDGRAGQQVVAEVMARRLGSPLDSVLKLTDAAGKQIAFNDDHEDKSMGLMTHHADSWVTATLPAKGKYYLYVADREGKGGPECAYRLRVSEPRPDFELRVVPATINARSGSTVPITVYALRRDGFTGDIALKLKDAPQGFTLDGGWVPAGQDQVRATLTVPATRIEKPFPLHLEGRAQLQGREVSRPAVPAENMMQAFYYHHLVPAREWIARVVGSGRYRVDMKIASNKPVKLPAGGSAPVKVTVPMRRLPGPVLLTLSEPPEGVAIQNVSLARDGVSFLLRADAAKAKPGLKGNLIVDAFTERATDPKKAEKRRLPLGTLPAIPFEIVAR